MSLRPALFLDRDGTLIHDPGAAQAKADPVLFPAAAALLRAAGGAGWARIVVTNQSAVARGHVSLLELSLFHDRLERTLHQENAGLEGIYFCPHHPEEGDGPLTVPCRCRKPAAGLFEQAIADHDIDPARSLAVGDRERDLRPAAALGLKTILVRTGAGREEEARLLADGGFRPDGIVDGIGDILSWLAEGGTALPPA